MPTSAWTFPPFQKLAVGEFAGKMQDDLLDAVYSGKLRVFWRIVWVVSTVDLIITSWGLGFLIETFCSGSAL
ncbi:hypothetical protein [Azohydromonas lata]|uniref:Uncharacterized protein n=1 Tax=Azohydromonas lata TaxID=45677 RepID=A0ABU5IIJ4_9BURK|nr:hypothetical protein [Azohydromonas lata]MDZ5458346.1 hypothetical protein [Azohydromonas lata]